MYDHDGRETEKSFEAVADPTRVLDLPERVFVGGDFEAVEGSEMDCVRDGAGGETEDVGVEAFADFV